MPTSPLFRGSGLAGAFALVACNALVGTEVVQYRDELAAEDASTCERKGLTQALNGDGGAPASLRAQCASVVIDGTSCSVAPEKVGLDLGLEEHGWTVTANVDGCFGGAVLTVSGVEDAPYPQTSVQPFLAESSAWLATNADATDDAGAGAGAFSSNPAGASVVEEGPVRSADARTVGAVRGSADVVAAGGARRHVEFFFVF